MCLSVSSASYWPQTKVISLVKNSLVLLLVSFLGLETKVVFSSPVQVQHLSQVPLNRCNSTSHQQSITDLIECVMHNVNFIKKIERKARATEETENLFENPDYYQPYPSVNSADYQKSPILDANGRSIFNLNIFNAMSSISKYDDYKCIPRIICEMATGVRPEFTKYKQSYLNSPINSLISFLSFLNIGESSSPLLLFGKSALIGYSNKGNPEICYHQYPRCPRNPNDLVNYLNNYNGGFFRFFNIRSSRTGDSRNANNEESSTSLFNPEANLISDRKGTGELKFDTPGSEPRSSFFINERSLNNKVIFPDDSSHVGGFIQSDYTKLYKINDHNSPKQRSFFPQDRKDPKMTEVMYDLNQYEDSNKEPITSVDGQSMMIDIDSSKLRPEHFKSTPKKSLINDDVLQPIDLEGLNVINLIELYAEDETQLEQIFHPCDMICHDSRGTSVQFSQVLNYGSLSTFMTPERPILDLSQPLSCQVLCHNERGEERRIFTTLSQTLRASLDRKKSQEYSSANESLRVKVIKPRFVGDSIVDEKTITPPVTLSDPNSVLLSEMSPMQLTGGQAGVLSNLQPWGQRSSLFGGQQGGIIPPMGGQFLVDDTPIGDNPLAIVTNASTDGVQSYGGSYGGGTSALPASFTMCGSYLYIVPLNAIATPVCTVPVNSPMMNQKPMLSIPKNPYGNYTNFFNVLSTNTNEFPESKNNFLPPSVELNKKKIFFPPPHQQVIPPKYEDISSAPNVPPDVAALNPGDYPQGSCLEGESWNVDDNQCVPIKSHEDSDYEYSNPRAKQTSMKEPFNKADLSPQRILIQTPTADINIQSN
ncbi:LOW QUALITY PROTEIN: uncharacterized protein [Chelonus insularis]|uniref:LOW QUALITY PROTEIN: uncharacterized protein n=1 Tax=Chelonus insularis TaxID=460826 RepID=UPI00158AA4DE|nr:LOW QUALITY PROTEIN: uncharacterized protein LOC118070289 [Chelonus insularis]